MNTEVKPHRLPLSNQYFRQPSHWKVHKTYCFTPTVLLILIEARQNVFNATGFELLYIYDIGETKCLHCNKTLLRFC